MTIHNTQGEPINFVRPLKYSSDVANCQPVRCPDHDSIAINIITTDESGAKFDDDTLRSAAHYLAKNQHYFSGRPEATSIQSLEQEFFQKLKLNSSISALDFLNPTMRELVSEGIPPDGGPIIDGGRNCYSASQILNIPYLSNYPDLASSKALVYYENGPSTATSAWDFNGTTTYPWDFTATAYKKVTGEKPQFGSIYADRSHSFAYLFNGFCVEKDDVSPCQFYHIRECHPSQTYYQLKHPSELNLGPLLTNLNSPNNITREGVINLYNKSQENNEDVRQLLSHFFGELRPEEGEVALLKMHTGYPSSKISIECFFDDQVAKIMDKPNCQEALEQIRNSCEDDHWITTTSKKRREILQREDCS